MPHEAAFFDSVPAGELLLRKATASLRALPRIILVGAMKCGTTSLYEYLTQHPQIGSGLLKEIKFFDTSQWSRGIRWYRAHFPIRGIGLDASTSYLFYEEAADRIAATVPDALIVCLLRDPAARAWSHFRHQVDRGRESRTFEQAVSEDAEAFEREGMPAMNDYAGRQFSYVRRGLYARQIGWYLDRFAGRVLVLRSEEMYRDPQSTVNVVCDAAGLDRFELKDTAARNTSAPGGARPDLTELRAWFQPHDEALQRLLTDDRLRRPVSGEPTVAMPR